MKALRSTSTAIAIASCMACGGHPMSPTEPTRSASAASPTAAATAAQCTKGLFTEATRAGEVDLSGARGLVRLRHVEIDLAGFRKAAAAGEPLTLNLFPDVCLEGHPAEVNLDGAGGVIWTGHIQGEPDGVVTTLVAAADVLVGSIVAAGPKSFQIAYAGNGVHVVLQINPAVFPPD